VKDPIYPSDPTKNGCYFQTTLHDHPRASVRPDWTFTKNMWAGPWGWGYTAEVVVEQLPGTPLANYIHSAFDSAAVDGHPFWNTDTVNNRVNMVCPSGLVSVSVSGLEGPYNALFDTWVDQHIPPGC